MTQPDRFDAGKVDVEETELVNAEKVARSLTGFDELAVQQAFKVPFEQLQGTFGARALLFVLKTREGLKAKDAHAFVMNMTVDDLNGVFEPSGAVEDVEAGKAGTSD